MSTTITLRPTSYTGTSTSGTGSTSNLANAYDASDTTYATFAGGAQNSSSASTYYEFDFSSIPQGAEIISATLSARASANNASSGLGRFFRVAIYDGTTWNYKINATSSTASVISSALTTAEITALFSSSNPRARAAANQSKAGGTGVTGYLYDLYLTVTYDAPVTEPTMKVKVNGTWEDGKVKVKVNGSWEGAVAIYVKQNGSWEQI